jgi:ABC-type molybdate transport system substrate-binding protein
VKSFTLPKAAQAVASYPIAVVSASTYKTQAVVFAEYVLGPVAQGLLRHAGFGPPPTT